MKHFSILLLLLISLSSCEWFQPASPKQNMEIQCAEPRLNSSFTFHDKAKEFLQSYYKTRKESELFFAWYASEDSVYMARSLKRCFDKRNKHFHAVNNVFRKNKILQKLIIQNMRQDSQAQLSELYLEEYRDIFVRDIQ